MQHLEQTVFLNQQMPFCDANLLCVKRLCNLIACNSSVVFFLPAACTAFNDLSSPRLLKPAVADVSFKKFVYESVE